MKISVGGYTPQQGDGQPATLGLDASLKPKIAQVALKHGGENFRTLKGEEPKIDFPSDGAGKAFVDEVNALGDNID